MYELVLASESPRRRFLLEKAGFAFSIFSVKVSEYLEKNLTLDEQIMTIAERKGVASFDMLKSMKSHDFLVLSADTMVIVDGEALGKPENEKQACEYLRLLSGRSHLVKTAVCMIESHSQKKVKRIDTTEVFFRPLSDKEIVEYVDSGEPMDKAGAYGIQGVGRTFVVKYEGAFDTVMGLPIELVKKMLKENSWNLVAPQS